jgi:hypothetical protein
VGASLKAVIKLLGFGFCLFARLIAGVFGCDASPGHGLLLARQRVRSPNLIRNVGGWTSLFSDNVRRMYSAHGKKIEFVAGVCKARVDEHMVDLTQIIAADTHDWCIAEQDIAQLTK